MAFTKFTSDVENIQKLADRPQLEPKALKAVSYTHLNKNLIRRAITIGQTAYPKMIYDKSIIANAEDITKMGVAIAIDGINVSDVMQKIGYLNPSTYNPDARNLTDEIRNVSQELAGASDAALGNKMCISDRTMAEQWG